MSTTETTPDTAAWTLDTTHSSASFAVKHMVVATYRTGFRELDASIELDGERVVALTGTVPAASIDIEDETLRGHVLSPEFFDVERTPEIRYVTTSVREGDDGALDVDGELTVKGITHPVSARGAIARGVNHYGHELIGIELETTIDRTAYDLNWNAPLPRGGFALANDVTLSVHLEFRRA